MKQTKISKAITLVISGATLSVGVLSTASATGMTMYNTYNEHAVFTATDAGTNSTDGWTRQKLNAGTPNLWVGTSPAGDRPLGYVGDAHLNWAATVDANDSVQISQQNAFDDHGIYADIDTAGGAWQDNGLLGDVQGWKHNTDIGLFQSSVTQLVTLSPTTLGVASPVVSQFGITVFEGQAQAGTGYSHHGPWNNNDNLDPADDVGAPDPFGVGVGTMVLNDGAVNGSTSFTAQAGQTYSIYLGGSGGLNWNAQHDGYTLDITTSAVPLPGAVWLMGSALLGMVSFGRKKLETA